MRLSLQSFVCIELQTIVQFDDGQSIPLPFPFFLKAFAFYMTNYIPKAIHGENGDVTKAVIGSV